MKTPRPIFIILLLSLLLSACAPSGPPKPPIAQLSAHREATFAEVENSVKVRPTADDELKTATVGQNLYPGGNAESGEDSRARIDLLPEGTIIRLAPNSSFTLEEFDSNVKTPFTKLQLFSGEIWVILFGGEFETETSYGTASVRGSMMNVSFDPEGAGMLVTCLEGHCALENDAGSVELKEGFSATIAEAGEAPSAPEPISENQVENWKQANPEVEAWLNGTPIAPPIRDEGEPNPNQPLRYSLNNNCPEGNWHWEFVGTTTYSFTLAPGESISGELPPGDYMITDTLEGAGTHGPDFAKGGGEVDVAACPD